MTEPMAERAFAPDTPELRVFLRHAELVSASIAETAQQMEKWTLKRVQGDGVRNG
jgi:hypothetical protein